MTNAVISGVTNQLIDIRSITSNTSQSRGMGVLSTLLSLGYGLFERATMDDDKPPIWHMLTDPSPELQAKAVQLLDEHEPWVAELAASVGDVCLQPPGVREVGEGMTANYDVIFGMGRVLALMYLMAKDSTMPTTIDVRLFGGDLDRRTLLLMALKENKDRRGESPMDLAITYEKLKKEEKLKTKEIADLVGYSNAHVKDYLSLLDVKLGSKRSAIHTGKLSVDAALKLLRKLRGGESPTDAEPARNGSTPEKRYRLPSVKGIQKIYEAKVKPKGMTDKEWELWTNEDVRKFLSYKLGFRFQPYKAPTAESAEPAPDEDPVPEIPVLQVKKKKAQDLLISLGMMDARTWDNETLKIKLESISNLPVSYGQHPETKTLIELLDKLKEGYAAGLQVEIMDK